ncbi:hypothetical protein J5I95_02650 [Candidatus Poribacteria bacterium]|nr:hypothetical protein [Candidatus Poribacteria bacterium]
MKKLLILLSLCICVMACGDRQKPAMDVVGDMMTPTEEPFADIPRITVADALAEDKITGPWLWMIAPTQRGQEVSETIDMDSLALASKHAVTETAVTTNGASEGDLVGELAWTLGTIDGTATGDYSDNINDVIIEIGLSEGKLVHHASYALIVLESDKDRPNLTMQVGSDDAVKVWLNGEVVHKHPVIRGLFDFQESFAVDLKAGDNLLLVKVGNVLDNWAMFVGLADPSALTQAQ